MTLGCGRIGVSLLPEEYELDVHEPDFEPDAESEDLDAAESEDLDAAESEDLDAASPADADLEWMEADTMAEEPPPIPSPDAGSTLDAAMSADASPAMDAAAIPDAALDATSAPDGAPPMDSGPLADAASSTDAGADAAVDAAGTDASAPDASLPACAGARVRNLCWYFGPLNNSCSQVCSSRGGYDSRMVGVVGTTPQGGTVEACNEVLAALGVNGTATPARRTDDKGYGCHQWGADLWWLDSAPDFRPDVAGTSARLACACLR